MFLSLNFILIFLAFTINQSYSQQDPAWYTNQLTNNVLPPYREAYTTLNENIVQRLLTANVDMDQTTMETFIKKLVCSSRSTENKLNLASKACEQIRVSLDGQIGQLFASIAEQNNKIQAAQNSVNQANINIQSANEQIRVAESAVNDKRNALNAAEHDLQEAHKAVERARLCGKKRRKRGFGRWWRKHVEKPFVHVVRQTVVRPVCSVVNSGGIDNAKERRGLAGRNLNEAQQRLHQYQQNLAQHNAQLATAQSQLNQFTAELNNLKNQLEEQTNKQKAMTQLTEKFKMVELHLKNVLTSSSVLVDALKELISFELMITPLNAIYHQIIKDDSMKPFNFEISAETTAKIVNNINLLQDKLPKMPLNEIIIEDASINCS